MSVTQPSSDSVRSSQVSTGQHLTFMIENEEYGIDIQCVQEIRVWSQVRSIPNTPSFVKGVINLRGTIVPIVDIRERFNLPAKEYGPTTVVIVLQTQTRQGNQQVTGIVVDAVSEVYNLTPDQMKNSPNLGTHIDTQFIKGIATVGEEMLILIDIEHLLDVEDLYQLTQESSSLNEANEEKHS